ncbi:MAG: hypothetical protein QG635_1771 [Bacteroidota bacterium]|nr:hypothetical protein [Bacteroidota bacterium]
MKSTKMLTILILTILNLTIQLMAQDDQIDNLSFETAQIEEARRVYFGIGVGYTGNFMFMNLDELNKTASQFDCGDLKSPVFLNGIEGYIVSFVVPNLRVNIFSRWGATSVDKDVYLHSSIIDFGTDSLSVKRSVELSLSYTGLSFDYAFLPVKSLAILPGIAGGYGNYMLEAYQGNNYDWQNIPKSLSTSYPNLSGLSGIDVLNRIETNFWFVEAELNIEYALTDYLTVRANGSYVYSFMSGGNWKFNKNASLSGVPADINANGYRVQFGVFLGVFNY